MDDGRVAELDSPAALLEVRCSHAWCTLDSPAGVPCLICFLRASYLQHRYGWPHRRGGGLATAIVAVVTRRSILGWQSVGHDYICCLASLSSRLYNTITRVLSRDNPYVFRCCRCGYTVVSIVKAPVTLPLAPTPCPRLQDPDSHFSRLLASERQQSSPFDVGVEARDAAQDAGGEYADLVGASGGGEGMGSAKAEEGTVWAAGDALPHSQ